MCGWRVAGSHDGVVADPAVWPHSLSWGYLPSGGLGFLLLVLIIQTLFGRMGPPAAEKP